MPSHLSHSRENGGASISHAATFAEYRPPVAASPGLQRQPRRLHLHQYESPSANASSNSSTPNTKPRSLRLDPDPGIFDHALRAGLHHENQESICLGLLSKCAMSSMLSEAMAPCFLHFLAPGSGAGRASFHRQNASLRTRGTSNNIGSSKGREGSGAGSQNFDQFLFFWRGNQQKEQKKGGEPRVAAAPPALHQHSLLLLVRMAWRSLRRAAPLALRPRQAGAPLRALSALPQEKPFYYQDLFAQPNKVEVPYRKLEGSENWVSSVQGPGGDNFLIVDPEALTALTVEAMSDIAFLYVSHCCGPSRL